MMTHRENETKTSRPSVPLALVAMEMGTTADALEREFGADVFLAGGFRSLTAFRAREVLEAQHARRTELAATMERNRAHLQQVVAERHARIGKGVQKFALATTTINPGGEGVLPVVAMTAAADVDFDGATYTRRPSRMDWLLGRGEGGGQIGPSVESIKARRGKRRKGGE